MHTWLAATTVRQTHHGLCSLSLSDPRQDGCGLSSERVHEVLVPVRYLYTVSRSVCGRGCGRCSAPRAAVRGHCMYSGTVCVAERAAGAKGYDIDRSQPTAGGANMNINCCCRIAWETCVYCYSIDCIAITVFYRCCLCSRLTHSPASSHSPLAALPKLPSRRSAPSPSQLRP